MSTLSPSSVVLSLLLREQREAQALFDTALARLNDSSRALDWFRVAEDSTGPMSAQAATKAREVACAAKAERIRIGRLADAASGRDVLPESPVPLKHRVA